MTIQLLLLIIKRLMTVLGVSKAILGVLWIVLTVLRYFGMI